MRTFKRAAGVLLAVAIVAAMPAAVDVEAADGHVIAFASPEAAYDQGLGALKAGRLDLAVPAFQYAADRGIVGAQYYLAEIYADRSGPYCDLAKAYRLYMSIADKYAHVLLGHDPRAYFVGKTLTALAVRFIWEGLPEIGLKPDPAHAIMYLHHAANLFNEENAQFELARHYLAGEPGEENVKRALHWLSGLSQKRHAPGQARLADIYWQGKHVKHDPARALALSTLAFRNAPHNERIWIADIHHRIFCGASFEVRRQAGIMIEDWSSHNRFRERELEPDQGALRTCANGEKIDGTPPRRQD
ncbi:MAG: tetratricopeptide repeat protein [Hyphomicrobiaceae bacterium]